jgi:hypothetical protein
MVTYEDAMRILPTNIAQAGADVRDQRDQALKKLLLGEELAAKKADQEAKLADKLVAREEAAQLRRDLQDERFQQQKQMAQLAASLKGGSSKASESPTAGMTPGQFETQVNKLGDKVKDSGLLESGVALKGLNESIGQQGLKINPVNSALPQWMVGAGEAMNQLPVIGSMLPESGTTEQLRSFEKIKATKRNKLYGAALSEGERKSFEEAEGLLSSPSAEARQKAINTITNTHNKLMKATTAGFNPKVTEEYKTRGGEDVLTPLILPKDAPIKNRVRDLLND